MRTSTTVIIVIFCLIGIFACFQYKNSAASPDEMNQINAIVTEAKANPKGKELIEYIKPMQKDGITKDEAYKILNAYEDWKLFYNLKDGEVK